MHRISDTVARKVEIAIGALEIPVGVKLTIGWDIAPALVPQGREMTLAYMVALSMPIPLTGDQVLHMMPLLDPYAGQEEVSELVGKLHDLNQAEVDEATGRAAAPSNGHKKSPGGLIMP